MSLVTSAMLAPRRRFFPRVTALLRDAGQIALLALSVLLGDLGCQSDRPAASAEAPLVSARLVRAEFAGGMGEVPDTVLVVDLVNRSGEACTVTAYQVAWGGYSSTSLLAGSKRCQPAVSLLAAGATVQDRCVVASRTQLGATPGLGDDNVRVSIVEGSCKPSP